MNKFFRVNGVIVSLSNLCKTWVEKEQENAQEKRRAEKHSGGESGDKSEKAWEVSLIKSDTKHLVYGVVLAPNETDSQNDTIDEAEIEHAAHGFMRKSQTMDLNHDSILPQDHARPVESYLAPVDFEIDGEMIKKGSWVMVTYIPDDEIWKQIEGGDIQAYSIRGWGKRTPA